MDTHESCQAGNRAALRGIIHVPRGCRLCGSQRRTFAFILHLQGRCAHVSGALSQISPQDLLRGGGAAAHHRHAAASGGRRSGGARLPVHRYPGHRKDHLRPDPGQGRQLRASRGRRALQPVRRLPGHRRRIAAGRDRAGRCLQRQRQRCPLPAGGGHLPALDAEKARVYHRRGTHALQGRLQRPAEDHGGAAGAPVVHSGHHRAAEGARHHSVPVPALFLQADPAPRHGAAASPGGAGGGHRPDERRSGAAGADGQRRSARRAEPAGSVPRRRHHGGCPRRAGHAGPGRKHPDIAAHAAAAGTGERRRAGAP